MSDVQTILDCTQGNDFLKCAVDTDIISGHNAAERISDVSLRGQEAETNVRKCRSERLGRSEWGGGAEQRLAHVYFPSCVDFFRALLVELRVGFGGSLKILQNSNFQF